MEHEKFQDLQENLQKMEEDYQKQLRSVEEGKMQALAEAAHTHEEKLQEKTQLLAQVSYNSEQYIQGEKQPFMYFCVLCLVSEGG